MEMDLAELGKVGRASFLVATVGVVTPMVLGLRRHGPGRRRLQHQAVRRRRADGDQRGHHRPGLRRPPGAGDHRGPVGARRGRGRRRDGPRRADRRGPPRDRGLGLGAVGGLDRRWWPWASWSSAASSASGWPARCSPSSTGSLARPGRWSRSRFAFALGVRPAGRSGQAGADRRRLRRRHRPQQGAASRGPHRPGAGARSATSSSRCSSCRSASTPTSAPSSRPAVLRDAGILLVVAVVGKLVSPLGAHRYAGATRSSSGWGCCPGARSA